MLVGLDWASARERVDALGFDAERRSRVMDLLSAIEAGALKSDAEQRAQRGDD